ncbi:MAG: GNAT family N-acetyltransferase, partial [Armatimonadota bacterium]|nr:GNAT family N-acetyltransferase [Armatimonadota bacterium]
ARAGRRVLGFVWFCRTGTFARSGYIRWIAVAPDARGAGVGRRLVAHAERRILAAGPNVFLLVSEFNTAARAFYRRLGYREVGRIPDYVVPGVAERLLRKTTGPIEGGRAP